MKRLLKSGIGALCAVAMGVTGLGAATQSAWAADNDVTITIDQVGANDRFEAFQLLNVSVDGTGSNAIYTYTENPKYIGYMLLSIPGVTKTDVYSCTTDADTAVETCTFTSAYSTAADRLKKVYDHIRSLDQTTTNIDGTETAGKDLKTDPGTQTHAYFETVYAKIAAAGETADLKADDGVSAQNGSVTGTYTFTLTGQPGYYLIHQTKGDTAYSNLLADTAADVDTTNPENVTVVPKTASLISTVKVKDYNTSARDISGETSLLSDWQDSADFSTVTYAVGWGGQQASSIWLFPFRLQATLPSDVAAYANSGYKLVFHNNMSDGFYTSDGRLPIFNIRVYLGDITYDNNPQSIADGKSSTAQHALNDENLIEGWGLECNMDQQIANGNTAARCLTTGVDGPVVGDETSPENYTYYGTGDDGRTAYTNISTDRPTTSASNAKLLATTTNSSGAIEFADVDESFAIGFTNLFDATYKNDSTDATAANAHKAGDKVTITADSTITVLFDSALQWSNGKDDEALNEEETAGSTLTGHVEYSVDPTYEKTVSVLSDDDSIDYVGPTTNSVTDLVRVFTYGLDVTKQDKQNRALDGAKFTLYQFIADDSNRIGTARSTDVLWGMKSEVRDGTTYSPYGYMTEGQQIVSNGVDSNGDPLYVLLDKGVGLSSTQTLVFTAPSAGWWSAVQNGLNVSTVQSENGEYIASFRAIGDGLYRLYESEVPAGYDRAEDLYFEIDAEHEANSDDPQLTSLSIKTNSAYAPSVAGTFTVYREKLDSGPVDGSANTGGYTGVIGTTVINNGGYRLPSTGGLGTFMLYTIGGLMILITVMGIAYSLRKQQQD